ncbi:MAG: GNAT family N-acetyltransferase [Clostridium sp.]|uniref:GNAT family N-acetyltransferase n=1 Tax=Clostridium sp. TaxID=1506 RepID=UPI00305CDDD4
MIKQIIKSDLESCLEIFHRGYETVAIEFGLTEENCPDRGRANLPFGKLVAEFEDSTLMYGYFLEDKIVGFIGIKFNEGTCKLNDIIVLPEYREKGYGKELLNFCIRKAIELGTDKIILGMIDDNEKLKNWYLKNDFINIGVKKFKKAPFTVGYMERIL